VLNGSNSIRVAVLAALVLAVAFSSTIASRLAPGRGAAVTGATPDFSARAVEQLKLNSAWQDQLSAERTQLQQAQQQQLAQQQAATAESTLTPTAVSSSSSGGASTASAAAGGSISSIIESAFASLGSAAVQWGLCVAEHESGDNPGAESPSGAEGLFQFMPSTFANTPAGRAGGSIWDAAASSQAAAWMYSQGQQAQWSTNSMC
jgi:soluble lytic murein transglycosylase-like protein